MAQATAPTTAPTTQQAAQQASPPPDPYSAFAASAEQPWNTARAAHLMRRVGFGAGFDRIQSLLTKSPQEAIDSLFDFDAENDPLDALAEQLVGFFNPNQINSQQEWWLYRILNTTRPLQEKMALVWHNHFATSANKVQNFPMMANQIALFRKQGLGSFRDLLVAVGHDPAMLVWLDGNTNRKGSPNENYGREVMELFTLGVGNYTEKDVQELARAFTGWHIDGNGEASKGSFNPKQFDDGEKTIFGKTGKFDSESAVDLLLEQPAASRHQARRLLKEFVHPNPTDEQIQHYADRLVAEKWNIKTVLREMVGSRLFFSDWAYRSKIKSPIELVVGGVNEVGGKASTTFLREQTMKMGQALMAPPNVKGWDGERTWINANTVLLRFNFGQTLSTQRGDYFPRRADVESWLSKHKIKSGQDIVDHFAALFLDGNVA